MPDSPAPPSFAAIVVAGGRGLRAGGDIPKQFRAWRGAPVLRQSVSALSRAGAHPIVVVIPDGYEQNAAETLNDMDGVSFATGGNTRQESVRSGLTALDHRGCVSVLIHDAARPDVPTQVVERLVAALETAPGAIPVLPVVDSLAVAEGERMGGSADRESLRRVQTPQAFRYPAILAAHAAWSGPADAGDDAQVLRAAGGEVALVDGDERLAKLTFEEDFTMNAPAIRTGLGFDVHRLAAGEELWLGGVRIEHEKGLAGHSDADVALHAVVDALLGAVGEGDIGAHFPPSDPQWRGAPSDRFITHALGLVSNAGYEIANVDLTIICEAPKIGPHRGAMRVRLAELLGVDIARVSVKATTTEGLGLTGRGEGIAAQAIATVSRF